MLPIFSRYVWLIIMIIAILYTVRDFKRNKNMPFKMKVIHITAIISGVCVVGILVGGVSLGNLIPNYVMALLLISSSIFIISLFLNAIDEIKARDIPYYEKRAEYVDRIIKPIIAFIIAGLILMYRSKIVQLFTN